MTSANKMISEVFINDDVYIIDERAMTMRHSFLPIEIDLALLLEIEQPIEK